ncbi:hypothetical protein NIIDMKKI_36490 [Mycobacterium kansasii]|uniref:Uncharacterized protein n=1 Tax=Mycobacterium kansasii TaxID=1768 RepID=A0A7G1IDW3_MYCKA|nr:hypothetical protein NIIDMKKI_36490 [Mycobacterium kansasii]
MGAGLRRRVGRPGSARDWRHRHRRRRRWTPDRTLLAATDLEVQRRTVGIADVDPLAVVDVDDRYAAVADIEAVEAAVVDGDPAALVEAQQQVYSRDQRVRDTDVGA